MLCTARPIFAIFVQERERQSAKTTQSQATPLGHGGYLAGADQEYCSRWRGKSA
jgi:hypothetical protein